MALQLGLTLEQSGVGVAAPEAYARIIDFHGDKNGVNFRVAIYVNALARQALLVPLREEVYHVLFADLDRSGGCWLSSLYLWLKDRPLFAGAIDLLGE